MEPAVWNPRHGIPETYPLSNIKKGGRWFGSSILACVFRPRSHFDIVYDDFLVVLGFDRHRPDSTREQVAIVVAADEHSIHLEHDPP